MKSLLIAFCCFSVFAFSSCEPVATFDQAQPESARSLRHFPAALQGQYADADEHSVLSITNDFVFQEFEGDIRQHKNSLDSGYLLRNDTLIYLKENKSELVKLEGDTVVQHIKFTDTVFSLQGKNILKQFKGYYFLNIARGDKSWEVKKLYIRQGVLHLSSVSSPEDISTLISITETKNDSSSPNFHLSKKQFKAFLRQGGFSETESFRRL